MHSTLKRHQLDVAKKQHLAALMQRLVDDATVVERQALADAQSALEARANEAMQTVEFSRLHEKWARVTGRVDGVEARALVQLRVRMKQCANREDRRRLRRKVVNAWTERGIVRTLSHSKHDDESEKNNFYSPSSPN